MPGYHIPLNMPHAATVAGRLHRFLGATAAADLVDELCELLQPYAGLDRDPQGPEVLAARDRAADLGRAIVARMEQSSLGGDRVGQCVRNLFECLELADEGAELSLRAGENPNSLMRPM